MNFSISGLTYDAPIANVTKPLLTAASTQSSLQAIKTVTRSVSITLINPSSMPSQSNVLAQNISPLSTGAKAGISISAIAFATLAVAFALLCFRQKRYKASRATGNRAELLTNANNHEADTYELYEIEENQNKRDPTYATCGCGAYQTPYELASDPSRNTRFVEEDSGSAVRP
jgi:hypothetical protein